MKTLSFLITLLFCLIVVFSGCKKKSENNDQFNENEQNLISVSSQFLSVDMVELLKKELLTRKGSDNYNVYFDSLNSAINRLTKTIANVQSKKSNSVKNSSISMNDFKNSLSDFQAKLKKLNGSLPCALKELGLGYGKGVAVDVSAGAIIALVVKASIQAHDGGGAELVYDFPTLQRSIFPFSVCKVSGSLGIGVEGGILDGNLSGYYDWITGFDTHKKIGEEFEGIGRSTELSLSGELKDLFGIGVSVDIGSWQSYEGDCGCNSLLLCSTCSPATLIPLPVKGYTVGFTAGVGVGAGFSLAIEAGLAGTCSFYKPETTENYNQDDWGRIYASILMANELLMSAAMSGITNPFVINDWIASYAALTYGFYNPNDCNLNLAPQLLTPVNGYVTSSLTPTLTSQPYIGATNYNFQVATESNCNNPIINANNSSCQYQIASGILSMGTQYFWRVKVTNSNGTFSPWSDVWSFTTYSSNMLGTPILLSPSNNSIDISPTTMLDWDDVANATNYELQIDLNGNFSSPLVDQLNISGSQYNNPTGVLQLNTKYFWRVKAKNSSISSLWSDIWNFTTTNTIPSNVILPLSVGNYWTYLPDITSQTVTISITGTIDIQGETCYKWFAQGDQYEWYYKNKSDGCWAYGYSGPYQYPPDLEYKYPANSGDNWITNWIAVPVPTTMTCESTNVTFESYSGCYKYHFMLPMKKDNFCTNLFKDELKMKLSGLKTTATDGYDIYQYFVPGLGMVGWENYFQGTRLYKVVLTDYHLN